MYRIPLVVIEKYKDELCFITKIKNSRSVVFRFESLLTHIFFYTAKKFHGISNWDGNECVMQTITCAYRSKLETYRDNDIDRMMKSFQAKMK